MSVESRPNKLTKGLVLDTFHTDVDNTVATYALNSQLEDQEGNHFHYGSEVGTTYIKEIPANHVVVGHINMERNETVLFTTDGTNSTIGILSRKDDMSYQYEIKVDDSKQTKKLGFKKEGYVRGVYRLLNGCDKVIYFVDGVNKDRRININQLDTYKLPTTASVASGIIFDDSLRATIFATSSASGNIQLIRLMSASPEATANVLANLSSGAELTKLLTASANGIGTALANLIRTANIVSSIEATGTSTVNVDIVRLLQSNVSAIGSVNATLEALQQGLVEIDVTLSGVASSTAILLRAALLEVNLTTEATTLANAILTRIINAQVQALANTESSAQISIPVNATVDATATTAANAILSYAINATVDAMAQTSATAQLSKVISASVDALADSSSELLIGLVLVSTNIAGSSTSTADLYINRLLSSSVTAEGTTTVEALIAKLLESSTTATADNTTTDLLVSKLLASTVDGLANVTANLQLADLLSTSLSGTATADNLLDITTIILADPYIDNVSLLLQGDDKPASVTQNNTFKDTSTNDFTITRNGNVAQGKFSPFDKSITNSGGSAYFDATTDSLSIPSNAVFDYGSGNFTIEFWIYSLSAVQTAGIISKRAGETYTNLIISISNARIGVVANFTVDGNNWGFNGSGTIPINNSTWYHFALVRNGSSFKTYINGVQDISATNSGIISFTTDSLSIGSGFSTGQYFNGYLSNVRIIKGTAVYTTNFNPSTIPLTAITNTSLLLNFTNAAIFDGVKLNNVETVGVASSTTINKFGTGAIGINGSSSSSDYITVPSNTIHNLGSSDFTIEFWLYVVSNPTTSAGLITRASNSGNTGYTIMYYPGYVTFLIGTNTLVQTSASSISTTTWTHIAFVRSGTSGRFFINGTQSGSTGTINNFTDSSTPLAIGALNTATGWNANLTLTGIMDDIRITKGIARYNTTFTTPSKLSNLIPNYLVNRSLRFSAARSSTYLNRTPTVAGSRTTWTWSGWVKLGNLSNSTLFHSYGPTGFGVEGFINYTNNNIDFNFDYNNGDRFRLVTNQVFRDTSAWYHLIVVADTTNATSTDRLRIYVNGIRITTFSTVNYPTLSFPGGTLNQNYSHAIGANTTPGAYFDGYMSEVNFIDGQALTPTSFGELDLNLGTWIPKLYSGTYGRNGFRLKFSDITQLGEDFSGNLNNWTPNGFNVTPGVNYDLMSDAPINADDIIGNYATWNPLDIGNSEAVLSNGNIDINWNSTTGHSRKSTISMINNKWYCEIVVGSSLISIGLIRSNISNLITWPGSATYGDSGSYGYNNTGTKRTNGSDVAYGNTFTLGDIIGIAFDADNGKLWFSKNGTWQASGNPVSGINAAFTSITGEYNFVIGYYGSPTGGQNVSTNFGQRPFVYPIPTGFKTLNTFNLPTPTIGATTATQANKFMDVSLYSGTGAAQSVFNSGFKPDLVWIKNRTGTAANHAIYDINRGVTKQLSSDSTGVETTQATGLTSFDTTGFTIGTLGQINTSGNNYIAWQWRASGTTVANNVGTIPSTVSVNTISGFSIVRYTGDSVSGRTVGHSLGVIPSMIIAKQVTTVGYNWVVWHKNLLNASYILCLDTTQAQFESTNKFNGVLPTSSVITLGNHGTNFSSGANNQILYAWAEIDGFSKFNSYVGNGSLDGTFVYTGFRPKFILIKASSTTGNWAMFNSIVNTSNPVINELLANTSAIENTTGTDLDFLSNGFKLRSANADINTSAQTYIYAAFGEFPLKYANAALTDIPYSDADVQAFFERVSSAGGSLTTTEKIAVNTLVSSLKANGVWTKMQAIYPMVGASAAACKQNLKSSSFTGTFTAGWTFASTGATPNGTSAYMDTFLNPSLQTNFISNNHQSFYSRTQTPSGGGWNMGIGNITSGEPLFGLAVVRTGNNAIYDSGNFPGARTSNTQTDGRAFWLGSCTASNLRKLIKNGTVIATNTNNDTNATLNNSIYVGALRDTSGLGASYMPQECAFASIGDGLTDTEASNFYTAVQAFQTTLSRNV